MTTTKIDPKGGITRYLQLYAALSQELAEGVIDPGALIPSEPSLVRKYRVSRTTVRRALARLESEGKIVRRRGSGTFSTGKSDSPLPPGERVSQVQAQAEPAATGIAVRQLDAHSVETPALVQKCMLNFSPSALMVRSLRVLHGRPFALATSYFVEEQPPAQPEVNSRAQPRKARKSRATSIAHPAERMATAAESIANGEQIVTAIVADAFSSRQLGIPVGAPLLQVRRLLYDARRRPLEYQDVCYRADLFELRMLMAADSQGVLTTLEEAGGSR